MRLLRLPPTIFRDDKAEPTKFPKKPLNWEEDMQLYSKFLDRKVRTPFWLILVEYLKHLQSLKKTVDTHFGWFRRKSNPFLPVQCWSESCCHKPCRIPQHWLMGRGRIVIKARTSAFYWTMSCPIFDFSGKHGDSCKKFIRCANYLFSMIEAYVIQRL